MMSMERLTASLLSFSAKAGLAAILRASASVNDGELAARHDMVDHAEPVRLVGVPDIGSEQHLLGLARAELPGMHEPFDAADAHRHHGIAELGIVAGDDQVAGPGQHQPAGDALAVHFRDGRLCQVAPAPGDLQVDLLLAREAAVGVRLRRSRPTFRLAGNRRPPGS